MPLTKYNCSQNIFYAAAHVGVNRLTEDLEDFAEVDSEYNPTLKF